MVLWEQYRPLKEDFTFRTNKVLGLEFEKENRCFPSNDLVYLYSKDDSVSSD